MNKETEKQEDTEKHLVQKSSVGDVIQSLPSDEILIELAKNNCMLHKTSDELGFLVTFNLNDLRQFCTKLLKGSRL